MLIQPSQADVRRFFCGAYAKSRSGATLEPIEILASQWIDEHPEYHAELAEQCSIDQPRGIRQAVELLSHKKQSLHDAHHATMECLGRMIFESQRAGKMPDGNVYIDCVQRHATKD